MLEFHQSHGYQKFKIRRKGSEIDTDEVFFDGLVRKREGRDGYTIETALSHKMFQIMMTVFFIIIGFLFIRCFMFQVIDYNVYAEKAEKNKFVSTEIEAQRGIIYDRNMKQIVSNSQGFELVCDIARIPKDDFEKEKSMREVSRILDISYDKLIEDIDTAKADGEKELSVARDLDKDKVIVLKTKEEEIKGFKIVKKKTRDYLNGYEFAQVVGYVSGDSSIGEAGVEKQYDSYLKEVAGVINREKDVHGNIINEETIKPSESGNNLVLNLDYNLQERSAYFLNSAIKGFSAKGGSVVAVNPKTGEVLAMVSLPSYDNNIFSKDLTKKEFNELLKDSNTSFFNRATSGEYPIGSTIKPILGVAALEQGIVTADKEIYCEGGLQLNDGSFKKDWKTHWATNLKKAIAESCDVYFYLIGGGYKNFNGLGITKIVKYLEKFGFSKKTGIDLPEEKSGLIPDPEWKEAKTGITWYPGDTYNISIGQGYFKATPLQLTMATSAIANRGKLMKPQIVKSVLDKENNVIESFEPQVVDQDFVSLSAIDQVRDGMRQTVTSSAGTARSLQYLPVTSAAKTGTAETGKKEVCHNWITIFAPYDDPEIVLTVMAESVPQNTGVANLVSREILGYYFGEKVRQQSDQEILNEGGN